MANRYGVGANGVSWLSTAAWSTTSGGAPGASVPGAADVAILDANSPNMVVGTNDTTATQDLNTSAYTGQVTLASGARITVNRHITMGNSNPFTGDGTIVFGASSRAGTWSFGNATIDCVFNFAGTGTKTATGNMHLLKNGYVASSGTVNGGAFYFYDGYTTASTSTGLNGNRTMYFKGGTIENRILGTGTCYLDGDVKISETNFNIAGAIRFEYLSGNIDTSNSTIEIRTGSSTIPSTTGPTFKLGVNCKINKLYGVGTRVPTIFLEDDLYCEDDVFQGVSGSGGSNVVFQFSGPYKIYCKKSILTYSTTASNTPHPGYYGTGGATIVMTGTGEFLGKTSIAGTSSETACQIGINVVFDTAGTITLVNTKPVYFTNAGTMTYTAGTILNDNTCVWNISGSYNFNINNSFKTNYFNVPSGATAQVNSDILITNLRISNTGIFNIINQKTLTVDNLLLNGSDTETPLLQTSPIVVPEFKNNIYTTMSSETSVSGVRRKTFVATGPMTTYTIAFDYIHEGYVGYTMIGGSDGYIWCPQYYSNYFYFFMTPSDGYRVLHGLSANGVKHRVVIRKVLGSALTCDIDGVSKSVSNISSGTPNEGINLSNFSKQVVGDVLIFNGTAVSTDWIASDYASFVANGGSSSEVYNSSEADLTYGWHVDAYADSITKSNLTLIGDVNTQKVFRGDMRYVSSNNIINNYFGTSFNCENVRDLTGLNFAVGQGFVEI